MAEKKTKTVAETKTTTKKTTTKVAKKTSTKKEVSSETKLAAKREAAAPTKATVTEAHAKALNVKVTPRKARLVIDLVRGKKCEDALGILFNTHKEAVPFVEKVIKSAMANAINNYNMKEENLYVASIMASDSIKMKRFLPRAKGSASGMVKRSCNIYVTVKEKI